VNTTINPLLFPTVFAQDARLASSHAAPVAHPAEVANLILTAARAAG
jgi:hypothetical protein